MEIAKMLNKFALNDVGLPIEVKNDCDYSTELCKRIDCYFDKIYQQNYILNDIVINNLNENIKLNHHRLKAVGSESG